MPKEIQPYWLNLGNAAKSCNVSPNTFKGWGIEPIHQDSKSKYFTVESILEKRLEALSSVPSKTAIGIDGVEIDYGEELAKKTQQERIRLELNNMEKTGELIPADLFLEAVTLISNHWGSGMDSLVLDIKRQCPDVKNNVLEIIEKLRINLQNELADWELGTRKSISDLQKGRENIIEN